MRLRNYTKIIFMSIMKYWQNTILRAKILRKRLGIRNWQPRKLKRQLR